MKKQTKTWEEKFIKRFCRKDKSNKTHRADWFLRDDITGKEIISFIRQQNQEARQEAIRECIKSLPETLGFNAGLWQAKLSLKKLLEKYD